MGYYPTPHPLYQLVHFECLGNQGKRTPVTVNGEAGHDLGVDVVEKVENTLEETHAIMILDKANFCFGGNESAPCGQLLTAV
jgi:hypothetical protein